MLLNYLFKIKHLFLSKPCLLDLNQNKKGSRQAL